MENDMIEAGDEVRLTGEALALADNELRKTIQSGADTAEVCGRFIEAAIDHVRSLSAASLNVEAFNCAITALLTLEVYKVASHCNADCRLRLLFPAVDNFMSRLFHLKMSCASEKPVIL